MGESKSGESTPWTKIIIFIIVAILIVAAIVFVVIRCCMKKKKQEKKSKKTGKKKSTSSSKSKTKSAKSKKAQAAKKVAKPAAIAPQVPIQVKPVDETMPTPSTSFTAPPTSATIENSNADGVPELGSGRDEAPRLPRQVISAERVEQKENVTVLCTYGKGWKAKTEPPKDFSFSIESD